MNDSSPRATGQCHCGAIRYSMTTSVQHHALCHCSDCRRHAGAPMVGWALVGQDEIEITGTPKIYASSEHGRRHFCGDCGTGLFYTSAITGATPSERSVRALSSISAARRAPWVCMRSRL